MKYSCGTCHRELETSYQDKELLILSCPYCRETITALTDYTVKLRDELSRVSQLYTALQDHVKVILT